LLEEAENCGKSEETKYCCVQLTGKRTLILIWKGGKTVMGKSVGRKAGASFLHLGREICSMYPTECCNSFFKEQ